MKKSFDMIILLKLIKIYSKKININHKLMKNKKSFLLRNNKFLFLKNILIFFFFISKIVNILIFKINFLNFFRNKKKKD